MVALIHPSHILTATSKYLQWKQKVKVPYAENTELYKAPFSQPRVVQNIASNALPAAIKSALLGPAFLVHSISFYINPLSVIK